jgi:hypothetical protein
VVGNLSLPSFLFDVFVFDLFSLEDNARVIFGIVGVLLLDRCLGIGDSTIQLFELCSKDVAARLIRRLPMAIKESGRSGRSVRCGGKSEGRGSLRSGV